MIERWCPKCKRATNEEIDIQRRQLLEKIADEAMQVCEDDKSTAILYELLCKLENFDTKVGL